MVISDDPQSKKVQQISTHLMTSGQLNIGVSRAHFEETNKLKYDNLLSDEKER